MVTSSGFTRGAEILQIRRVKLMIERIAAALPTIAGGGIDNNQIVGVCTTQLWIDSAIG